MKRCTVGKGLRRMKMCTVGKGLRRMKMYRVGKGLCVHRRVMMHKMCANLKDCEVGTYVTKTVGQTLRTVDTMLTQTPKFCLAKLESMCSMCYNV